MTQSTNQANEEEAASHFALGIALASLVLVAVYFGISRLVHEYFLTFILASLLSFHLILVFHRRASRIRLRTSRDS